MKLKLFSVKSSNRKAKFDMLEEDVNAWLAAGPNIVIVGTNQVSQPNFGWEHLSLAVWYTEE